MEDIFSDSDLYRPCCDFHFVPIAIIIFISAYNSKITLSLFLVLNDYFYHLLSVHVLLVTVNISEKPGWPS